MDLPRNPHHRPLALQARAEVAARLGLSRGDPRLVIPTVSKGQKIGLFGGSFDPPHAGHRHAAHLALTRLGLDQIWWMVTPVNPLKRSAPPTDLKRRLDAASAFCQDRRIKVTAFEARLDVTYTARVLHFLKRARPGVHFVWVMGGDNLMSFHRWQDWRWIMATTPIAIVDRPSAVLPQMRSRAAQTFWSRRVSYEESGRVPASKPAKWVMLRGPRKWQSSTKLRASGLGL